MKHVLLIFALAVCRMVSAVDVCALLQAELGELAGLLR